MADENNLQPNGPGDDPGRTEQIKHTKENIEEAAQPATNEKTRRIADEHARMIDEQKQALTQAYSDMLKNFGFDGLTTISETLRQTAKAAAKVIDGMHDEYHVKVIEALQRTLSALAENIPAWIQMIDDMEIFPFLEDELLKPEYGKYTISELLKTPATDENGNPLEITLFEKALNAAKEAQAAEAEKTLLPQIQYTDSKKVKTVTDKFANLFFSLAAPQSKGMINGQRQFIPVRYEKRGAKKEITLLYDYSFNEDVIKRFGLSKSFDDQAFFVASVVDNLFDEGNTQVSLTKLWHELGNDGSPNTDALTNLVNILRLGMSTVITADISEINAAWGIEKDVKTRELISPVMPVQIIQEKFAANGKTANAIINITGHTPFYLIGYPIDHYSTWTKDVLRLYKGRRTKRYYSVLRFLITQIAWIRNPKSKRSNKILYETLYDYTGDKTTRARQLSRDMMYRLLDDVFIPTGYVRAYKEDAEKGKPGVVLTCSTPPQIANKK